VSLHRLLPLLALVLNLLLLGSALAPDRRSARNRVFACFLAALAVWNLGVLGLRSTMSPETADLWERFLHIGVIALPVLFYHYVVVFLEARGDRVLIAGYAGCVLFWLASFTPTFLVGVTPTVWGFMPVPGPVYPVFFVYFNAYLVLGLHRLLQARRSMTSSFMRNRTLLVVAGVMVSLAGGIVDLARFIFRWDWLYPPGIATNAVFALALGVAVLRYRLMDVRLLAKRVLVYVLTALAVSPLIVAAVIVLQPALRIAPGPPVAERAVRDVFVLALAFAAALPVLNRVGHALDRLMFRRQHGVRDALVALANELPRLLDAPTLGDTLTTALVRQIPASHVSLQVVTEASEDLAVMASATSDATPWATAPRVGVDLAAWLALSARPLVVEETAFHGDAVGPLKSAIADLERQRVALLLPLILERRLAAVLTVGEKLSGELYEADDIELLETLLQAAAVALKNAGLYADLQGQMREARRAQSQLMQAAKLAAIGELAASIGHEVNNPLTVVIGTAAALRRRADLAAVEGRLATIETQAWRAANMVRGLLDFARRRARNPTNVPIRQPIERALALVADRLRSPALETITLFDETEPTVFGDRDELTQVFINLITNAIDAMPRGGRLAVSTDVRRLEEVSYLSVRVADTGVGIPPEHWDQIFESFFTTKPEGQGTGLGLAVTLEIVKTHEGTIEVESVVGKGTTMIVNLPLGGPADDPPSYGGGTTASAS
jgi:signal transduction histidine kinase